MILTPDEYLAWRRTVSGRAVPMKEIARVFGISPTRVMQLEQRALRKLAAVMRDDPVWRQLAKDVEEE